MRLPLIEVEPKDCVVDELHLFLRITDIRFNTVFARLHALDLKSKLHGTTTDDHVRRATYKIRKMGISFSVWLSQEGNGKQSRTGLELTPLLPLASDRKGSIQSVIESTGRKQFWKPGSDRVWTKSTSSEIIASSCSQ